jgi:ABC-type multidrug transport system ATPase subunit
VEDLLSELGLLATADTPVGSVRHKTLSGGERKRTAIGVELITDPSLILLDEPTSGLDSFKALQIVKLLKK